jgi:chromosome segregation ATPase
VTPAGLLLAGGALAITDFSQSAQIFGLIVMVTAAVAIGRGKQKDQTIATLQDSTGARLERIKDLEAELRGASTRADQEHELRRTAEKAIARLEGELRQMERYTAKEALEQLATQLGSIESAIVTAIQSNGEIVLRNTEILADVRTRLEAATDVSGGDVQPLH